MEVKKTLWMLDYRREGWSHLIPLYAEDEQGAWVEAYHWATQSNITLPEDATLIHFPQGFTMHRRAIPGCSEE